MFDKSVLIGVSDNFYQVSEASSPDDVVSVENTVGTNVSDSPDCLLNYSRVV